MTALFAIGLALAQSVSAIGPVQFHQTVSVDKPFVYTMRGDRPEVTRGTLVVFNAPAKVLTPTQGRQSMVYIGEWPVRVYARNAKRDCAVGWVPMVEGFSDAPLYLGPETLPERVTPSTARQSRAEADLQAGAKVDHSMRAPRHSPSKTVADERALADIAQAALSRCQG